MVPLHHQESSRTGTRRPTIEDRQTRHVFYLVSAAPGVGLTSVSLGLVQALDREGIDVGFFKPFRQPGEAGPERSTAFLRAVGYADLPDPLSFEDAEALLKSGGESRLLQEVVENFEGYAAGRSVIVVEGLQPTAEAPELETLNRLISKALDGDIIFVSSMKMGAKGFQGFKDFQDRLVHVAEAYGGIQDSGVIGCIVNKFNAPTAHISGERLDETPPPPSTTNPFNLVKSKCKIFADGNNFSLIGVIPFENKLLSPRTYDVAMHLGATIVKEGDIMNRRVDCIKIIARSVKNMIRTLKANTLIITPADRDDIILAVCMAASNGVPLAGLALTGDYEPDSAVLQLCSKAFHTGLPLLLLETDSYISAANAANIDTQVAIGDIERIKKVMNYCAERLSISNSLLPCCRLARQPRMSPAAFMYLLETLAQEQTRRIVLPEGLDPRIIKAAVTCHERRIARCTLLGDPSEVQRIAAAQDLELPEDLEILNPTQELRVKYVDAMLELRKHKGLTKPMALAQLEDVCVLGTMMLAAGDVDGLVSGACHSTANTVRPALQLIKTRNDAKLISSIFFMLLPNQVVIYGDCAINPDPNAAELADIALQSAASAEAFGIEPRVAMLSYSTGTSGKGSDVDKVREATHIAQEQRPDLLIDGPLQFDAACTVDVASTKAPNSKVAGKATVLVFPDLNTGNTTYKAVQRTANVVAVGPMLQGLRRPVNDLSRGCLVDDIVYTIALTAIQANQAEEVIKTPVPTGRKRYIIEDSARETLDSLLEPPFHQ